MTHIENIKLTKGEPTELTVTMSVEQAALISNWAGQFSPSTAGSSYEHTSELFNCLEGEFFNRFYEDGLRDAIRELGIHIPKKEV